MKIVQGYGAGAPGLGFCLEPELK